MLAEQFLYIRPGFYAYILNARALLASHDAYTFFELLDDLILTGPTRTNVNDYRVILVL